MEHGARQNTTRVIAVGFISLGTLLTLSLATNIIQGINNYRLQTEQKVAVTPMLFRAPFAVSQNQADASYIEQLGLSFVALRLNVTPETVDAQHQQLLRYVLPASQNSLKVQLAEDAKGTVAKLAMRQPFVLFKGLTFQKLCLPGAFRPGDHH
ncbi:TraE/TraK family type IV conjugative transfer system protein, partial [Klebsiella pneumoniae]|uniref:TraE/TraK family type IV conjugative transfer system protein n=3 Tax=Klebsiella pneumoniae TaxID=573 RepID=UPI00224B33E4